MDTIVTDDEIREYYENNIDNFILAQEVVKATFVKVPLTAPDLSSVRSWIKSESVEDLDKLEKYCFNYAEKFDNFNDSWIYFKTLMKQIPLAIDQPGRFLRYNNSIETSDSMFHYFLYISDHKSEGEVTPLELIRDDIISILLNKRKIEFYNDLEKKVYTEGVNRNQFEIF
ncbi:MAG: peptidyl-prolyl cis-trans isomerase [Bacteroidales bacterium]|nr:peptidyl-prolyl cis-trans isomerase [Bacteroidales bacterium]